MKIIYFLVLFCLLTCQQTFAIERVISLEEIKLHRNIQNCWIIVNAKVYNISKFIKDHEAKCNEVNLIDYCGKDASKIWSDKQKSENAHKNKSVLKFESSQIGIIR